MESGPNSDPQHFKAIPIALLLTSHHVLNFVFTYLQELSPHLFLHLVLYYSSAQ
jgi:hypothetical protein